MKDKRFNKRDERPRGGSGRNNSRNFDKNKRFDSSEGYSRSDNPKSKEFRKGRNSGGDFGRGERNYDNRNRERGYNKNRDFGSYEDRQDRGYQNRRNDDRFNRDDRSGGGKRFDRREDSGSYNDRQDRGYQNRRNDDRFNRDDRSGGGKRFDRREDSGSYNDRQDRGYQKGRNDDRFNRDDRSRGGKRFDRRENSGSYDDRQDKGHQKGRPQGRFNKNERFRDNDRFDRGEGYNKREDRPERSERERIYDKRNKRLNFDRPNRIARKPEYNFSKINEIAKKKGVRPNDEIRLNRYIANAGICSRRDADALIQAGDVKVNGKVVTEMGFKVGRNDEIRYKGKVLKREHKVYVLLNKPKDFITTTSDPDNRRTVMQLVNQACEERIYPVGRLDRNTTGLLLLTNDGEIAERLAHPSNNIKKIYNVELNKPITEEHFKQIWEGLELEDGEIKVDDMALLDPNMKSIGLEIHSGRNRIVRRIFEHLGYDVVKLDRTTYAGLTKKDLPRGKWRFLTEKEVIRLKFFK